MPSMSEDKIEFEWGATRGKGGAKKDVQFYESFKYDGSNYSLYDSVYLYKDGVAEPYIGKIIKIWEPANKSKKVKILWFFRPSEISSYIGGLRTLENELFLGTGAGMGLENINSLEAIAGKCNVICISKDKRNRPPSPEELSLADFVFYRTFDVDNFTISDQLGECISNVKVELLLNKENPEIFNPLRIESNDKGHGGNVVATPEIEMDLQKRDHGAKGERPVLNKENPEIFNPLRIESNDKGHGGNAVATPEIEMDLQKRDHGAKGERPVLNKENPEIFNPLRIESNDKGHGGNAVATPEIEMELQKRDHGAKGERPVLNKENPEIFNPLRIESNDKGHGGNAVATPEIEMDLQKRDHGAKGERPVLNKENPEIFNPLRIESNDKGHGGNAVATPEIEMDLQKRDHGAKGERPVNDFLDDRPHKKLKSAEAFGIRAKSNAPPKLISKKDTRPYGQVSLVTRRPDADNSKWFTGLPWKDSMKAAQEEGTLVLLQNLDLTYTSSEIEDIVWHSFSENCTAKVSNCASSPHSTGQAYVIFKTQQAAVNVVRKLEEGCLMLPNGRPLIGHIAPGQLPRKSSSFPGHLLIDRLKFSTQKDKRDAVSTSHSSQPNTLEYDMAMEWRLLQERFELMQKKLLKKQREEMIPLKGNLKRKF